ncbi:MAG TPA: PQQ-binding-like beta-propeller repeat protein, partial [Pirellulales bacterium]|nr:PQQ-binding-like beta-propeller repeat protein [Pirellulales bacterium]
MKQGFSGQKKGFRVQGLGFSIFARTLGGPPALLVWTVLGSFLGGARASDEWPQFRGPDGQGHAPQADPPLEWSETSNVVWRTPIPGLGWSSPVVGGRQIWLTTAHEPSRTLRAICIDRATGRVMHDLEIFRPAELPRVAAKNSHASPTPVLDGNYLYVHFGSQGTACLARDGQVIWRTQLEYDQHHGSGGSPVVWRDLLIVQCDGYEMQSTVALDKR